MQVHLVDVSRAALETASRAIGVLPGVTVVAHQAAYETGWPPSSRANPGWRSTANGAPARAQDARRVPRFEHWKLRPAGCRRAAPPDFRSLRSGDAFLLGADLIKPERDLQLAYDDPLGVTAAFNLNLLLRINRELGADFDVAAFRHRALWNAARSRVEMHLVSLRPQHVRIPAAGLEIDLRAGEIIWTESSYKYASEVLDMLHRCGFRRRAQWVDDEARFALTLVDVV